MASSSARASGSAPATRKPRLANKSSLMFINAVYFPSNAVYSGSTPAKLNYSFINMVYYAFAKVTSGGNVFLSDEYVDVSIPCDGVRGALGSLMHLKEKHPHLRVLLAIGGAESSSTLPDVAANPVYRDNFARSALGLVEASGLDGIDVNWLYPTSAKQGNDLLSLLAQVRIHLPEDEYLVTTMLPWNKDFLQLLDLRRISEYVDMVNVTAYDMYGPWSPKCGHHAQLYSVGNDEPSGAATVQYLLAQGVPSKKILLGIPVYGRSFLNTTGTGHKFSGSGGNEDGTFDFRELPRRGTKEQTDKRVVAAACSGGDGGFVSYDNPDTVRIKAAFCKQKALGGLFYWAAPSDSKDSKRSIIAAGFRALHGS